MTALTQGVIGLGNIGGGVAAALVRRDQVVVAYDVAPQAVERLTGVNAAASPRAVAEAADIVFVAVLDDQQVRDVLTGADGILKAAELPRAVVILSTITLDTVLWAAEHAGGQGVAVVDCGVTGGSRSLAANGMVSLVGGDDETVALVEPSIALFSSRVLRMGGLGTGMKAKLARNLVHYSVAHAAWEGARLAAAAGVDIDQLAEAIQASDALTGGSTSLLGRRVGLRTLGPEDSEDLERQTALAVYAHKDLAAALALAVDLGVDLPGAELVDRRFDGVAGLPEG
jgi:3-hydroxyisobutyrate dehydrogenase